MANLQVEIEVSSGVDAAVVSRSNVSEGPMQVGEAESVSECRASAADAAQSAVAGISTPDSLVRGKVVA